MDRVKQFLSWLLRGWIQREEAKENVTISFVEAHYRFPQCYIGEHEKCQSQVRTKFYDDICTCPCHVKCRECGRERCDNPRCYYGPLS
jgi:hypothetical protein